MKDPDLIQIPGYNLTEDVECWDKRQNHSSFSFSKADVTQAQADSQFHHSGAHQVESNCLSHQTGAFQFLERSFNQFTIDFLNWVLNNFFLKYI